MSQTKLTKLTDEQKSRFDEWAKKWIEIGLCTDEADWATFERGVTECYAFTNLKAPRIIVRCQSPIVVAWAGPIAAKLLAANGASVYDSVGNSVGNSVYDSVRASVGASVGNSVYDSVYDSVYASVGDSVYDSVGASWSKYFGGQFWVSWQTYMSFFRDVCKLELPNDLWARDISYSRAQSSACWWWPHTDFVIVSNRPKRIFQDDRHRLHDYNRLAIEFRDGWGVASFHGVMVPDKYAITPADKIDPTEVLNEKNAEVRTAVIAKMGFARLLGKLPHRTISWSPHGEELIEFDLNGSPVRGLHCKWEEAGGLHETVIPVWWRREQFGADCPDNIDDAEQVRLWTFGLKPNQIKIVAES